jgi:colanic acid/amylovoran biosynthesis glycosyltransferase
MRIAVVVDAFPALSETFVLNQITGLLDMGHDVQIFPTWHTSPPKVHEDVITYGLLARTHPIPATPKSKVVRLLAAIWIFAAGFVTRPRRTLGLARMVLSDPRSFSLRLLWFMSRFPADGFDVIHCHYGYNGLMLVKLRRMGVKGLIGTVFHGHDMYVGDPTGYRELFARGEVFLPISQRWKEWLVRSGCPAEKTLVHHMGIDLERFPFKTRTASRDEQVRILTVARLVQIKGLDYLLKALAEIVPANPNVILTIAGDGPLRADLEALARQLNLQEHVEFLGGVEQERVRQLMSQAHIFVLPSITTPDSAQEGIPLVLMEAMASGLPVVTTRYSCMPELVNEGKSGYLVPEKDPVALAQAVKALIVDPEVREKFGSAGHEFVKQGFNIRVLNNRLEEIYRTVLSK